MARDCRITASLLDRQRSMFRIACDPLRYGNTLKSISLGADIPYSTLRTYAEGAAEMPLSALHKLTDVLPDVLLSMLAPVGRVIVQVPEEIDHDEIEPALRAYQITKSDAHHPDSEAGREIGPNEDRELRKHLAVIRSLAA